MCSRAPEIVGRNEKICTHRTRKWHSWLSFWKEELFSPTLPSRLCLCPRMSAHASLLSESFPQLTWQADVSDIKAGYPPTGKLGHPKSGASSVQLRRLCRILLCCGFHDQLGEVPLMPRKPRMRVFGESWLVPADLMRGLLSHRTSPPLSLPHLTHGWGPECARRVLGEGVWSACRNGLRAPGVGASVCRHLWSDCMLGVFCISHLQLVSSSAHLALIFPKVLKKKKKKANWLW